MTFFYKFIFMFISRLIEAILSKNFCGKWEFRKKTKMMGGAIEGRRGSNLPHTIGEIVR